MMTELTPRNESKNNLDLIKDNTMTDEQFEEGMQIINPVLAHLTYLTQPRPDGKLRTMDHIALTFIANCQANNVDIDLMLEDLVQAAEGIRIFGNGLMITVAQQKERGND